MLSIPPPRASRADRDPDPYEFDPEFDPPQQLPLPLLLAKEVLDAASLGELLQAYNLIGARLPSASLKDTDMEQELVRQKLALQDLQARVLSDPSTSPQHKAQVANSLSAALANLVKVQENVYTAERAKKREAALIEVLDTLDRGTASNLLNAYEAALEKLGGD